MNADRLLAQFERISDAPDAIPRMRRFILDLAVRGKLVEQDPEDEPAEELLKAISLDSLQSKGRRATAAGFPGIAIKGSFAVPDSWVWTLLGGIGDWGSGSTPPRGRADYYSGDISWFKSGELGDNKSLSDSEEKITHLALGECSFRNNKPGDILIAMYGATIGKLAILAEEAVTNQAVCACTPCWGVDTQYLYLFLLAKRDDFRLASEGGAQPNISKVKIVNTPIPLPPLAEQHRIVAKVDELMALCDQLEAARQQWEQGRERLMAATLQRLNQPAEDPSTFRKDASFALQVLPSLTTTPAQIKQLRQTILNLAVRGKLVEQDPEDEAAEELSRQISLEREWLVMTGAIPYKKPAVCDPTRSMEDLPINWIQVAFGDLCNLVTSGSRGWAEYYSETGVGFIRAQNIRFGRLLLGDMACVQLPPNSEGARTRVEQSDLLVVITGAGVTNPALLDQDVGEAYVSQHVGLIRPTDKSLSPWLLLCLMAPAGGRDELVQRAYGSGKPGLNLDNIRSLTTPLPPLAEQHRIVAKVAELMAFCDQLEQQLSQADQQRRRLLEALLAEALLEPEKTLEAAYA
jgi:type I restriction enzyme S subunit